MFDSVYSLFPPPIECFWVMGFPVRLLSICIDLGLQSFEFIKNVAEFRRCTEEHDLHLFVVLCEVLEVRRCRREQFQRALNCEIIPGPSDRIEPLLERNYILQEPWISKR